MNNAFAKLHLSILLAGFTGILGKLITLPEGPLVWYRMLMASALLAVYLRVKGQLPQINMIEKCKICGVGVLVAIHWVFFYGSIKYANVSIAVVCFAMTGFFTSLLEPLCSGKRISIREVAFSLITVAGVALIFHFDIQFRTGIILGILCAFFAAIFTIAIRRVGSHHASTTMLYYQMLGGFIFLSLAAPAYLTLFPNSVLVPDPMNLFYLFLLASLCTIGMFILQIQALKSISAFTVNLSFNLEPVYSIVLAMFLFNEAQELGISFFIGLGFICTSVMLQTLYTFKLSGGHR